MTNRKHQYLFGFFLAWLCYENILLAGPVDKACEMAHVQLSTVVGGYLNIREGEFVHGDTLYKGCILTLRGDTTKVKGDYHPTSLFYPFKESVQYRDGWRADSEADGPDGSFFRIHNTSSFCLIEGRWDGGDDSDSQYVPSPEFSITIKCAAIK